MCGKAQILDDEGDTVLTIDLQPRKISIELQPKDSLDILHKNASNDIQPRRSSVDDPSQQTTQSCFVVEPLGRRGSVAWTLSTVVGANRRSSVPSPSTLFETGRARQLSEAAGSTACLHRVVDDFVDSLS